MKPPSTIAVVTGSAPTHRAADAARRSAVVPPSPERSSVLPRVDLLTVLIEVAAVAVVQHDGGEVVHLESADRLRAEILIGHHRGALHELREHGARAAD